MKLRLRRIALKDTYTIGKLEVLSWGKWVWIADTLEDKVRDINKNGVFDNGETKVYGETAIPYGTYEVTLDIQSPKYSNFNKYPKYKRYDGYLPRLLDVPHFEGVLLHIGNSSRNSSGCILLGENKQVGKVLNSTATFYRVMDDWLIPAKKCGETITLEIV